MVRLVRLPAWASLCALGCASSFAGCGTPAASDAGDAASDDAGESVDPAAPDKGPWVLRVDTTRATVRWESKAAPPVAAVDYAPAAGGATSTTTGSSRATTVTASYGVGLIRPPDEAGTFYLNDVDLTGLAPASCYDYTVVDFPSATGRICTMHEEADRTNPIRFMAIGDTNPILGNTAMILAHVLALDPEFVVHAGDIQYYSSIFESWQAWFGLMAPMLRSGPMLAAVGNHEDELNNMEFADYYGRLWDQPAFDGDVHRYHFASGGVHFIALDTEGDLSVGSPQVAWFAAKLDEIEALPDYRFTIVYFHRPSYTLGDAAPQLDLRVSLDPLIAAHNVPLVLAGHMHGYERFEVPLGGRTVTFLTTAGGGGTIGDVDANVLNYPADAPLRVASGRYFHAMMFTVDPGRTTIHAEAIDERGAVVDTFDVVVP